MESNSFGTLGFTVWPAYVGVCQGIPPFINEPMGNANYERGQINWRHENEQIVGSARIIAPKGIYTHLLFFQQPTDLRLTGIQKLKHPLRMTEVRNVIDVDPIVNEDLSLNVPQSAP